MLYHNYLSAGGCRLWYDGRDWIPHCEIDGKTMIGTKLNGRYEVVEHLGEGATSTVYKGVDTLLGREVALKVLLPHVRETTRKRFFQEAMSAARLNHPNIMSIHDRGVDNSRHFLVIEYVDGDTLSDYIPSSADMVVALGVQIAKALHYAHERDIIHRDIKPANIKVTTEGQVKIMDLGLARPRDGKRVTAPGMVIGTPAYISPEQAQGQNLDRRTDIYSLGIVLFEMATGQLPFNADDITALMLQHVQEAPPKPRAFVPTLPPRLESIILRCLEKQPSRRFQTGNDLGDALAVALQGGDPHPTQEPPTVPSRPDWADRLGNQNGGRTSEHGTTPSRRMINVVLADDHTLLRRTLANYLQTHPDMMVVAEAKDGDEALHHTFEARPDILLLDLNMPGRGGLEVLPIIREQMPDVKVLVLTGRDEDGYIMRALRGGAHGYVLKSIDEEKLVESIRQVMDGELVLGRGVADKVLGELAGGQRNALDDLELDVLKYISAGYFDNEIGERMGLGMTGMIETMASIMNKLGVRDRNTAALKALRTGVITLDDLHDLPPPARD